MHRGVEDLRDFFADKILQSPQRPFCSEYRRVSPAGSDVGIAVSDQNPLPEGGGLCVR